MESIYLERDIKVFYVTAKSFPEGIRDATDRLHRLFPFSEERNIFGISRPESNQGMVYRAAAEELEPREAEKLHCDTLIIKKGTYISIKINDFRKDVTAIGHAFKKLLAHPGLDPEDNCVEWYSSKEESVNCMIRIEAEM